jgi:hypothetical protein
MSGVAIVAISRRATTADQVRSRGQPAPIVIREPQAPSAKLTPQDPILFDQVRDGLALPAIQPAGQHNQHHLQGSWVDHELEPISRLARRMSTDLWNSTPQHPFAGPSGIVREESHLRCTSR